MIYIYCLVLFTSPFANFSILFFYFGVIIDYSYSSSPNTKSSPVIGGVVEGGGC